MKLYEVIIHTKTEKNDQVPETLYDGKEWAANEMSAGMKAMDKVKEKKSDITPDQVEVLVRPF